MALNGAIPRFLLPRSSWKVAKPPSRALAPPPFHSQLSSPLPHRPLSTQARHLGQPSLISQSSLTRRSYVYPQSPPTAVALSRSFSTTQTLGRDHHFDTLKFVQRLKDEGFSEEQSKAMMLVLSDVIEESIQNLTRTMVLREGTLISIRCLIARPA